MNLRICRLVAFSTSLLLGMAVGVSTEQTAVKPMAVVADGLLRSEVSLGGYTASVAYLPTLRADDPAHRALLSPNSGSLQTPVRVARLETNGTLRVGELSVGKRDPAGVRYDLWLEGTSSGWQLQVTDAANAGTGAAALVGRMSLARQPATAAPQFVAALVPETANTARLVLQWGEYQAVADVTFAEPPRQRRVEESRGPNVTTNRTHDEDTSALSRARLLAQRNETAIGLANGQRLSVSFQRTFTGGERSTGDGGVRTRGLPVDGPDYTRLSSTPEGAIVMLTEAAVPRLRIDVPLRFGKALLATGNQVPGVAGSYGIWLKRAGSGWRLVFNHEPDVWGSQHDAKADAAEIELQHSTGHAVSRPFAVGLVPRAADRGRLLVIWGPHEWSADFQVAQ